MKWGIIGLGNIAHDFTKDLALVTEAELWAVASRSEQKADAFAEKYQAKRAYGRYEDLLEDQHVEIVYIATPHDSHAELAIKAMLKGKHVLCEKPMAVNQEQVTAMVQTAQEQGVFLMEAFWTRFNPSIRAIVKQIREGDLGEVNYVSSDFTFYRSDPPESRMLNMDLAGGSLLDMGVYPVFLSYLMLGVPDQIHAFSHKHPLGADLQTAAIFYYPQGLANMMSGFQSQSDMVARICGTKGSIFIDAIWHETQAYTFLNNSTGERKRYLFPTKGKGFTYEIETCMHCIQGGELQCQEWTWQNSFELAVITDKIRQLIGLKYPFE